MSTPEVNDRPRSVDAEGIFNARDLGGLPAADGRVIAHRRLYRAELLAHSDAAAKHARWNPSDSERLAALEIRTVLDMRGPSEVESTPSAWAEATGAERSLSFPIDDGGEGTAIDFVQLLLSGKMERFGADDLGRHYVFILEARARTFGDAITAIADGAPALIHCTEGKDRTGLLVALVLGALGVPVDEIVDDYELTEQWRPGRAQAYAPRFEAAGIPLDRFRILYESPAEAMRIALDHLLSEYGSVSNYLRQRAELPETTLDRLCDVLLEPVAAPSRAATVKQGVW